MLSCATLPLNPAAVPDSRGHVVKFVVDGPGHLLGGREIGLGQKNGQHAHALQVYRSVPLDQPATGNTAHCGMVHLLRVSCIAAPVSPHRERPPGSGIDLTTTAL